MMMTKPTAQHEEFPNGARIQWVDYPWRRWSIEDAYGVHHGYRRDLDAARAFASELPGSPIEPEPERVIPRSPRAMPLEPAKFLPTGARPDERAEEVWRPPTVHQAYGRAKALTRRYHQR